MTKEQKDEVVKTVILRTMPMVDSGLRVYGKDIDDSAPGIRVVDLHKDAVIIGVGMAEGRTTLWLAGSGKGEMVKVRILLATNGMSIPEEAAYLGSVGNGAYVMHVLKPTDQEITHTRP